MSKNKKAEYPEFYCCYLLRSLQSKHRNYVYIGTTPNPIQRLRQHNGEIAAGAHKTEKKRPWEMLLLVHGFPTNTAALQFEWAWTYDHYSRHFPGRLTNQKTSLKSRLDVLHEMLRLDVWNRWPLALHLVAADSNLINTDMLPKHIKVTSGPLQTMRYTFADKGRAESERKHEQLQKYFFHREKKSKCSLCPEPISIEDHHSYFICREKHCKMISHRQCLAKAFLQERDPSPSQSSKKYLLPVTGQCPACKSKLLWGHLARDVEVRIDAIHIESLVSHYKRLQVNAD